MHIELFDYRVGEQLLAHLNCLIACGLLGVGGQLDLDELADSHASYFVEAQRAKRLCDSVALRIVYGWLEPDFYPCEVLGQRLERVSSNALRCSIEVLVNEFLHGSQIELIKILNMSPRRQGDLSTHVGVRGYHELREASWRQVNQLLDELFTAVGAVIVNSNSAVLKIVDQGFIGDLKGIVAPTRGSAEWSLFVWSGHGPVAA